MRFCQLHWDALKAAVDARGMTPLIAATGTEAFGRLASSLEEPTQSNFDPLMDAHMRILSNATRVGGPAVVMGDGCPLCLLNAHHKAECTEEGCTFSYDPWIDRAADDAKARATKLGLLGAA